MKVENKNIELFIAEDGKEFLTENECDNYEKNVLTKLKNIKYFKYCENRDLNETGLFFSHNYAAVYLPGYNTCHKDVLMQYLLDKHGGKIIQQNVQGYGVTTIFEIYSITIEQYFESKPNTWGGSKIKDDQIFISEEPIDGYPTNIPVMSKHFKFN